MTTDIVELNRVLDRALTVMAICMAIQTVVFVNY